MTQVSQRTAVHAIVLHASRCTNNCVFCGSKDFGDIEQNVLDELGRLQSSLNRGDRIDEVEISGNDPGEFPKLPLVVQAVRKMLNGRPIRLASHGKSLIDPGVVRNLVASGVTEFIVPIYGHTSKVHDAVTRTPGSFIQTIRGLNNVVRNGAKFRLTCLITKENQPCIREILHFLGDLVCEVSLGIPYFSLPDFRRSVPDLVSLRSQLSDAVRAAQAEGRCMVKLRNIPRCLLEYDYEFVEDSQEPPMGAYEHWRRPEVLKTGFAQIIDGRVLPKYRQFSKTTDCEKCKYEQKCPGFLTTYLEHGLFWPQPIY